jgi:acyl-CoA synthetase (AMP-forming)/AMP-acid ligase II
MLLHEYFEYYAREAPEHPCVEMEGQSYDYAAANRRTNRMAHAFRSAGLDKPDRISWLSRNCIDLMLLFYAASKAGVVPVPLNYRLAPPEWRYIINDSEARVLVCEEEYCVGIDSIRNELEHVDTFICIGGDREGWRSLEDWLEGQDEGNPGLPGSADDDLYQMYTSGTTGLPKGAILSQGAIDSNTRVIGTQFRMNVLDTRLLLVLPMYHAAAGISHMCGVSNGASIVIHRDFDPVATIDDLEGKSITNCTMVPAQIQACLVQVPDIGQRSFPQLRTMGYGASPIAEETLRQAIAAFDCNFCQVFGMTETTACATALSPTAHRRALSGEPGLLASCGRAAAGTEIRIVDEQGEELPRGAVGEIAVRGPQLMKGYWNLPEATARTLRGGWLFTGDAARMDEEGFVYIQDRIKDMIVSGGENVYPKEVENALFDHPSVADAAVIGIPDERWGETILAFLVLREGEQLTQDEAIAFCRERLAGYKVPRQIEYLDEIPRNASGKVLKKDLREPYWKDRERRVG